METSVATTAAERVGFWPRVGAALIDSVVVWGVAALTARSLGGLFPGEVEAAMKELAARGREVPAAATSMIETTTRLVVAGTLVASVYCFAEGIWGRALGKLLLGLRIGGDDGRPASVGRLWARVGLKNVGGFLKLAGMLTGVTLLGRVSTYASVLIAAGCLLMLWPRRQALHDLGAKTAVFHASDLAVTASTAVNPAT